MPSDADLQLLLDAFVGIASERSERAILEQAVDLARLTTRARYGAAARVVDGRITVFAHRGMTNAQVADLPHEPRGLGMLGAALLDRKPIRLDRMDGDARAVGFPLGHVPMRAYLSVPLAHGEEHFGALYLTKPPGHDPFTEADELFVAALGRQTALALEGARALAEVERANAELRRTDELKDQMLSMTSHELRTPLTAIRMATGTLRGYWHDTSEERRLELIAIVDSEAHRLSRLVENLLTAASIGAGSVGMQRENLDLAEAVTRAIRELLLEDVAVHAEPGLIAWADRDHVRQILVNYLGNAAKYGSAPIEVHLRRQGPWCRVEVCDRGAGVPSAFVPTLFERFARAEGADPSATRVPGTGLGLSIVRALAEAGGGEAWYAPRTPGSCFGFQLPAVGEG